MFKLSQKQKIRLLEIFPGAAVIFTFLLAIILSLLAPLVVIYFILIFSFYWIVRILYLTIFIVYSWFKMRAQIKIDWQKKAETIPNWKEYYHLLVLPTYKEGIEVIRTSFNSLIKTHYPLERFIVVLGGEERDEEHFKKNAAIIEKEFGHLFYKFMVTVHPKDLPDEIPGKGANTNWMGHRVKEWIDEQKIPYEKIIESCFDVDTCVHEQYFAYLTYKFLTHPDPLHISFQPVTLYHNNIWQASAILRVVANCTTFWLLTDLARPERLFTFSSHSMSFKALVDVDFWTKNLVTEDTHIFFQCFTYYQGNYRTEPMYIPVSMDTVQSENIWKSLKSQYKQVRRWAWTVEQFPEIIYSFFMRPDLKIPLIKKWRYLWNFTEGIYTWATAPILLFALGYLPFILAGPSVRETAIAQNTPFILQQMMTVGMIGLLLSAILSTLILPPLPKEKLRPYCYGKYFFMLAQWILLPLTMIFFGSIPAIDAQLHLLSGKMLGFNITEKFRKNENKK